MGRKVVYIEKNKKRSGQTYQNQIIHFYLCEPLCVSVLQLLCEVAQSLHEITPKDLLFVTILFLDILYLFALKKRFRSDNYPIVWAHVYGSSTLALRL